MKHDLPEQLSRVSTMPDAFAKAADPSGRSSRVSHSRPGGRPGCGRKRACVAYAACLDSRQRRQHRKHMAFGLLNLGSKQREYAPTDGRDRVTSTLFAWGGAPGEVLLPWRVRHFSCAPPTALSFVPVPAGRSRSVIHHLALLHTPARPEFCRLLTRMLFEVTVERGSRWDAFRLCMPRFSQPISRPRREYWRVARIVVQAEAARS